MECYNSFKIIRIFVSVFLSFDQFLVLFAGYNSLSAR